MTDQQTTEYPEGAVNVSYTFTLAQVAEVTAIAERLNCKRSEVVRKAVDFYYQHIINAKPQQ